MSITSLLIADLRFRRGRLAEATSDCLRALAAFKRRADRPGEADAYRILGAIHTAEGAWAEADQVLRKSLEINLACGQRLQSAETERELGRLEERRGNPVEARRHFAQARSRFQEVGADGAARELDLDLDRLAVHEGSG
jgi:tetratricopeptide (TPR) repeat protein